MTDDDNAELSWDATPFPPEGEASLDRLGQAAKDCHGCDLYQTGAQTVFGEGPRQAEATAARLIEQA